MQQLRDELDDAAMQKVLAEEQAVTIRGLQKKVDPPPPTSSGSPWNYKNIYKKV